MERFIFKSKHSGHCMAVEYEGMNGGLKTAPYYIDKYSHRYILSRLAPVLGLTLHDLLEFVESILQLTIFEDNQTQIISGGRQKFLR